MTAGQPPQSTSPADPRVAGAPGTSPATTASLKQTERPHPLTPFVRGWLVFVAIALLVTATGAVTIYLPARRASRLDPLSMLRSE